VYNRRPAAPSAAVPTLSGVHSFQSVNYPSYKIRHQGFRGKITPITASALDVADSSFKMVPALTGTAGAVSFESVNYPGYFLRHRGFQIWLDRFDGSQLNKMDASFMVRAGNAGRGVSFESVNYKGRFIRHAGFALWLHPKDGSDLFNQDSTFLVRGTGARVARSLLQVSPGNVTMTLGPR